MLYLYCILLFTVVSNTAHVTKPKSAWDCDDDKLSPKYYDEACTSDNECFGRSMSCREGKCKCLEDNIPEERVVGEEGKQTVCVSAPNLFAECKTVCQKPYVCKAHTGLNEQDKDKKVCQCETPFKLTDGYCHLECAETEYYDPSKLRCFPRCKANEVKVNDTCLPSAKISEPCQVDIQCQIVFSECKSGQCSCMPGFSNTDGSCVPESVHCPNGAAIAKPVKCKIVEKPVLTLTTPSVPPSFRPSELVDDCPPNQFCSMVGAQYKKENATGFCCPKIEAYCQVGRPHPTGKCRSYIVRNKDEECPYASHFCSEFGNGGEQACCPRKCDSRLTYVHGRCYASAELGDACSVNEQCYHHGTVCIDGKCRCPPGSIEVGRHANRYCSVECKPNEQLYDGKCYTPLSLGDSCVDQSWRCPTNAICNKHKVCSCACPRFTLSKDICAPIPVCPKPRRRETYYRMGLHAESMAIKGYEPISEEKRKDLLQNVTFCSIPNKQSPKVETVAACPADKYCASFIPDLGICCKKPEFVCPNGKKPVAIKNCDVSNPLSCGVNQYCHNYLYTADPNSDAGKMCCEQDADSDDLF